MTLGARHPGGIRDRITCFLEGPQIRISFSVEFSLIRDSTVLLLPRDSDVLTLVIISVCLSNILAT